MDKDKLSNRDTVLLFIILLVGLLLIDSFFYESSMKTGLEKFDNGTALPRTGIFMLMLLYTHQYRLLIIIAIIPLLILWFYMKYKNLGGYKKLDDPKHEMK